MVEPAVLVAGIGAVAEPVPPVAFVYHKRLVPPATNGLAVANWQYVVGVVTVGAAVVAVMLTVINARGLSQPLVVWLT